MQMNEGEYGLKCRESVGKIRRVCAIKRAVRLKPDPSQLIDAGLNLEARNFLRQCQGEEWVDANLLEQLR